MATMQQATPTVARVENENFVATADSDQDQIWIQQILNGDSSAFINIDRKYRSRFMRMAVRILGNETDAEDAVQETFIQAYRHLPAFQNKSRFSTWLYAIALNHLRNRLRHAKVLRWISIETKFP